MKLAILSDTHDDIENLEKALAILKKKINETEIGVVVPLHTPFMKN